MNTNAHTFYCCSNRTKELESLKEDFIVINYYT